MRNPSPGADAVESAGLLRFRRSPASLGWARQAGKSGIASRRCFPVIEILQSAAFYLPSQHVFDVRNEGLILATDEGEGIAGLCRTTGSTMRCV